MLVARNIEAIMSQKGTNANAVAKRLGTNPTLLYDILSGKSKSPRLDTLHKIAVIGLGVPVSALLMEPTEADLDQEVVQTFAMMPPDVRRRMLHMAQAWLSEPASAS
jgi:transcriptional regulator with XRE-family HTH domain